MKDKTCLSQLPQLQSYVLGLVLAVSSLCTTIRSISDPFPRRCLEEKVLGKGKGFQWFLQRVAFALFPWSFMSFRVFPHVFSSYCCASGRGILVPRPLESPRDLARLEASTASADFVEQRLVPVVFAALTHLTMKFKPELESQ